MVIYILVLINIVVFIMIHNGRLDADDLASSYHMVFNRKQYYRIITSAFTHQDLLHIGMNMLSLINVGEVINRYFGPVITLVIYFGSLILGKILSLQIRHNKRDDYTMSMGASGAICGLIGAYFLLILRFFGFDGLMSMARPLLSLLIMSAMPGVDGTSHFSCMAMGMLITWIILFLS